MPRRGRTTKSAPPPPPAPAPAPANRDPDRGPIGLDLSHAANRLAADVRAQLAAQGRDGPEWDAIFLALVESAERWFLASKSARELGPVVESAMGSLKPNPAFAMAAKANDQVTSILSALGLTPASFARIGLRAHDDDDLDRYLSDFENDGSIPIDQGTDTLDSDRVGPIGD